jgi:hypothetical protein
VVVVKHEVGELVGDREAPSPWRSGSLKRVDEDSPVRHQEDTTDMDIARVANSSSE